MYFYSVPESQSRYAVRILGRKYALTTTAYKYLEIGINVGSIPTVEIILSDNRGNHLLIHIETWRELMEKRVDIQQLLRENKAFSPLQIRDLTIEFCKINDSTIVKLTLSTTSLYLKFVTMNMLFSYKHCIDHMYAWLSENTHLVSLKFKKFVNILCEKNVTDISYAEKAIRKSDDYDCESLIDCELLACGLKNILYEAMN